MRKGAWLAAVLWAASGPALAQDLRPDRPNEIAFPPVEALCVRLRINAASEGQPCIDELEVYAPEGRENLALAARGARASASSCLAGHAIHQVAHLNDGRYGNGHSWIAAGTAGEWAQIELPRAAAVARVVFSRDREGRFRDRMPVDVTVLVSRDGQDWKAVARAKSANRPAAVPPLEPLAIPAAPDEPALLRFAFAHEAQSFWRLDRSVDPIERVLGQMERMIDRFAARGMDTAAERAQRDGLRRRQAGPADPEALQALLFDARLAKRRLMFRDPGLAPLGRILFVKRHPYLPSHNYSDIYDSRFTGGGGVCVLEIPARDGRLAPAEARVTTLFDAGRGIARDAEPDWEARTITFAFRPPGKPGEAYWNLRRMDADGGGVRAITDGPFHDYYPCVLPDGDVAFVSTRCRRRFLCWVPQSMVLFRMGPDGSNLRPLSHANLSEWGPSILRDGRILWTRSEYLDKGADYGHTLWAARPDGTHVELVYGNNSQFNLMNGREVPDSGEICATLISHFGDFNGPIALIDPDRGRFNPASATVITPDHRAVSNEGRFRDPFPVSRDCVLVSHLAAAQWALYVIDRHGNREVLYADAAIGCMGPVPLRPRPRPPVIASAIEDPAPGAPGRVTVTDVYAGLGPAVKRGTVKYLRIVEEIRSPLERRGDGRYVEAYPDFHKYYASPVDLVSGPHGWPTYVAKGVLGTAPVEEDGSAHFEVPAGRTIYFQALDGDFNEVQRMRSVLQLQEGEVRGCVGCHEDRASAGVSRPASALARPASRLQPPPWGAGPFDYSKAVQPVLEARCVSCHDGPGRNGIDLSGALDQERVPASYASLIRGGWVHHFPMGWNERHHKAGPLTFGTVKSRLFPVLEDRRHADAKLKPGELQALKCWIDLNCPLWPDYTHRHQRPASRP